MWIVYDYFTINHEYLIGIECDGRQITFTLRGGKTLITKYNNPETGQIAYSQANKAIANQEETLNISAGKYNTELTASPQDSRLLFS